MISNRLTSRRSKLEACSVQVAALEARVAAVELDERPGRALDALAALPSLRAAVDALQAESRTAVSSLQDALGTLQTQVALS